MFGSGFSDYSSKNNNRIDKNIIEHKKSTAVPFFAIRKNENYEIVNEEKNNTKQNVFESSSPDLVKNQSSSPPDLTKNQSRRKVIRMSNNRTKAIPQRGRCRFSCLYPDDHISDERLDIYYPRFLKDENKKLDSFKTVVKNELSQYNRFKELLMKRKNPSAFSKYQTSLENMEKNKDIAKSTIFKIDDLNKKNVIVKKFKGNEEVSTIYTKDNRNHSLTHSFIAKYPLASDPFDVTCIFVMMFVFSFSLIHS